MLRRLDGCCVFLKICARFMCFRNAHVLRPICATRHTESPSTIAQIHFARCCLGGCTGAMLGACAHRGCALTNGLAQILLPGVDMWNVRGCCDMCMKECTLHGGHPLLRVHTHSSPWPALATATRQAATDILKCAEHIPVVCVAQSVLPHNNMFQERGDTT